MNTQNNLPFDENSDNKDFFNPLLENTKKYLQIRAEKMQVAGVSSLFNLAKDNSDTLSGINHVNIYTYRNPRLATMMQVSQALGCSNLFEYLFLVSPEADLMCLGLSPAEIEDIKSMLMERGTRKHQQSELEQAQAEIKALKERLAKEKQEEKGGVSPAPTQEKSLFRMAMGIAPSNNK